MAADDAPFRKTFRPRRAHKIGGQHVEHRAARHAREKRDRTRAERERGKHQKRNPAVPRRRQPLQCDGEQQDQEQTDPVDGE